MRFAVIDDERPSRSELCHLIRENLQEADIDEADSGQKALELASENDYDAFFVDVHLGDMTGTTLSLMLRKLQPETPIVFATAYDTYAVSAFEQDAADYIMKPFDPKRVAMALEKIKLRLNSQIQPSHIAGRISVTTEKRVVFLDIAEIAYIEADSRCCVLHTCQGDYVTTQTLACFEKKLAQAQFFRIHKSFLVNLQYITELSPWFNGMFCVKLRGRESESLPVGRKQVKRLKEIFDS